MPGKHSREILWRRPRRLALAAARPLEAAGRARASNWDWNFARLLLHCAVYLVVRTRASQGERARKPVSDKRDARGNLRIACRFCAEHADAAQTPSLFREGHLRS